jgi:hypothetical protein
MNQRALGHPRINLARASVDLLEAGWMPQSERERERERERETERQRDRLPDFGVELRDMTEC